MKTNTEKQAQTRMLRIELLVFIYNRKIWDEEIGES
jgi:hypothetical protein